MPSNYSQKKHLFFDMDDTVTQTRTPMEDDVYELYASLDYDLIIVSGGTVSQIQKQVRGLPFYTLGQNGNQAYDHTGVLLWNEKLTEAHTEDIFNHISALQKLFTVPVRDPEDIVEHRGSQISYSLIGHNEELQKKKACDPDQQIRKSLLTEVPLNHDEIEVKIGGTTCLDYFQKGKHKGYNITKLLRHTGWNPNSCLYFGDSLFPGGNDETVIGVIDTVPVENHRHTYDILRENFLT